MAFAGEKLLKMMDWKEREHKDFDTQALNDPNWIEDLRACGLLKFFRTPRMQAQLALLRYLIILWDINHKIFFIGD